MRDKGAKRALQEEGGVMMVLLLRLVRVTKIMVEARRCQGGGHRRVRHIRFGIKKNIKK